MTRARLTLAGLAAMLAWPGLAGAQDLQTELAAAQAKEAEAEAAIEAATPLVEQAERELAPILAEEERAQDAADEALARVRDTEEKVVDERVAAADEVASLEAAQLAEEEEHDDAVATGVGVALAAISLILIPMLWPRFRELGLVDRLAAESTARAFALVAVGVFVGLAVGGAFLVAHGWARAIGAALVVLALGSGTALLWARHSLLVEAKQERPLWTWERLRRRWALLLAVFLLLIFAGGLGSGPFSEEPAALAISPNLERLARQAEDDPADPPTPELIRAIADARPLVDVARDLKAARDEAEDVLRDAEQQLAAAESVLRGARGDVATLTRRIEEEAEQAALAAARAARAAEREAQQAAAQSAADVGAGCEPGYSPCVPPYPPDVDCEDVGGSVSVTGSDPHGLDGDGDGTGCDV